MNTVKKIFFPVAACVLLSFTMSCITTPVCFVPSSTPVTSKSVVQKLGKTEGSDSTWSFLGLWMWGRPDIEAAMKEAIQKKGGNALVDVRCYRTFRWFVLVGVTTVNVEGEAVRVTERP